MSFKFNRIAFYSSSGYGSPLDRPAALVQRDLDEGCVSPADALNVDGVALNGNQVKTEASAKKRADLEVDKNV